MNQEQPQVQNEIRKIRYGGLRMITLAYDETTGFESIDRHDAESIMLAGIVYKSGTEKKYKGNNNTKVEPERARIVAYLRAVCKTAEGSFPRDLHSGNNNGDTVKKVKQHLSETLPEFFKSGTYNKKELIYVSDKGKITEEVNERPIVRQGTYQIIAVYKSQSGKTTPARNGIDLQRNDVASNLYLNMAEDIINKGIFLNPYLIDNKEEVVFDLPTRVISRPTDRERLEQYEQLKKEYEKLGYEHVSRRMEDNTFSDYWQIMSPGLAQQIIRQADKTRHINVGNISIESINYDNENTARKFAFLYLSDCVCSFLDYKLKDAFVEENITPDQLEHLPLRNSTKNKLVIKEVKKKKQRSDSNQVAAEETKKSEEVKNEPVKKVTPAQNLSRTDMQVISSVVGKDLNEGYAQVIRKRMRMLNNRPENMFYYYDDVDTYYEESLQSVLQGQLFETLSSMYDGRHLCKGNVKRYYVKKWFPVVEKLFVEHCSKNTYQDALRKARTYRVSDNIAQGRFLYIFEMLEQNKGDLLDKATEYQLYDLGISAYTHVGNPYKAEECFEKCLSLANYVEESDVRESKNRMITVYNDQFRFKDAETMAAGTLGVNHQDYNQETKSGIKGFAKFIRGLFSTKNDDPENSQNLIDQIAPPTMRKTSYKAWSSLGQAYAFERAPEAEDCFIKVLDVLKDEKTADYYITLSYLLHLYIENGEQEKYEECAKDFFNDEADIEKQLDYLMDEGTRKTSPRFSFKYALYIYIKAFYVFYKDLEQYQPLLRKLTHIDTTVRTMVPEDRLQDSFLTGHPWEIIYKYAALLEAYDTDGKYDSSNRRNIKESVRTQKEFIIDRIIDYGDIEYKKQRIVMYPDHNNYDKEYEKSVLALWKTMVLSKCVFDKPEASISEKEEILSSCFTYMYH